MPTDFGTDGNATLLYLFYGLQRKGYAAVSVAPWNIAVITAPSREAPSTANGYRDLKNALLYAGRIHWVATDALFFAFASMTLRMFDDESVIAETADEIELSTQGAFGEAFRTFRDELNENDKSDLVISHLDERECLTEFQRIIECDIPQAVKMGRFNRDSHVALQIAKICSPSLLPFLAQKIGSAVSDCRVVVDGNEDSVTTNQRGPWNSYRAANDLQRSINKLMLPDVSKLEVTDILECRNRFSSSLDPMRAELLRLTEDLRELVSGAISADEIAAEVENIVATRVEPVIREAAAKIEERKQKKWRELYAKTATAFGFTGASFVNPAFIAKAVKEACETTALLFADPEEEPSPVKATAQFVLQVHTFLTQRARRR